MWLNPRICATGIAAIFGAPGLAFADAGHETIDGHMMGGGSIMMIAVLVVIVIAVIFLTRHFSAPGGGSGTPLTCPPKPPAFDMRVRQEETDDEAKQVQ